MSTPRRPAPSSSAAPMIATCLRPAIGAEGYSLRQKSSFFSSPLLGGCRVISAAATSANWSSFGLRSSQYCACSTSTLIKAGAGRPSLRGTTLRRTCSRARRSSPVVHERCPTRNGDEEIAVWLAVGETDVRVALQLLRLGSVVRGEEPEAAVERVSLRPHRPATERPVRLDGGHHGGADILDPLPKFLLLLVHDLPFPRGGVRYPAQANSRRGSSVGRAHG